MFPDQEESRIARHRRQVAANGSKRVEVTVPSGDAAFIKTIASALRAGGKDAQRIKEAIEPLVSPPKAKTGPELIAFLRQSPLAGADLEIERDTSKGRSADLV